MPSDVSGWSDRGLFVITTERPGFGASARSPRGGFVDHADDLVAVLDAAGIETAAVVGPSGAAPYILVLCQQHASRVKAATVLAGSAPMNERETTALLDVNRRAHELVMRAERAKLVAWLDAIRRDIIDDINAAMGVVLGDAPASDRVVLDDQAVMAVAAEGMREARAQGVEGWADEATLLLGGWNEIEPESIDTSVTWLHGRGDRNCPITAARRLVARLPRGHLIEVDGAGHDVTSGQNEHVLDELLARCGLR